MEDHQSLFRNMCMRILCNDFTEAIAIGKRLLELYGNAPAVRHNLALAYECSQDFVAAAAEYNETIRTYPKYMGAHMGLANCCLYEGDAETAEQLLRVARSLDPQDPRPAILLSEVLFLQNKEEEGIREHLCALQLIETSMSIPTQSHAHCYIDLCDPAAKFHMFLERSLIQRDGYPTLPPLKRAYDPSKTVAIFLAHMGNAADVSRRLASVPRDRVYLLTLDTISSRILEEHVPDASVEFSYEIHELPAVALYVARCLTEWNLKVLVPSDDGRRDDEKLAWADAEKEGFGISKQGDLVAVPEARVYLDPRMISPMYRKGTYPDSMVFVKVFSQIALCKEFEQKK